MYDQANDLRDLVRSTVGAESAWQRPRMIVVTGGTRGVGTTTIAMNLAVASAAEQQRVVLVDADPDSDGTLRCSIPGRYRTGLLDILHGHSSVRRALEVGPADIRLLARGGVSSITAEAIEDTTYNVECSRVHERLIIPLQDLGHSVDTVIVDAGNGSNRWVRHFWQAADSVLLLTTDQPNAIMDAYASIKLLHNDAQQVTVHPVVNRVSDPQLADDVRLRIARAAYRFLAIRIGEAYRIPDSPELAATSIAMQSLVIEYPECESSRAICSIVNRIGQQPFVEVEIKKAA